MNCSYEILKLYIVSTTLGIFSALELEILLVCLSRDTWLVIAHFRRGCSQFNRRRSWVGFHQHYFVKRVSFQQMIVHYATNVLLILSSTLMRREDHKEVPTCTLVRVYVSKKGSFILG